MPEAANYISQLNPNFPPSSETLQLGDDHIRLIKSVLKATFPNANRAFNLRSWSEKDGTVLTIGSSINLNASDSGKILAASSGVNIVLPSLSSAANAIFFLLKTDAGSSPVSVSPQPGELINGISSLALSRQYQGAIVFAAGSSWFAIAAGSAAAANTGSNIGDVVTYSSINGSPGISSTAGIWEVGDYKFSSRPVAPAGFLLCDGKTIGKVSGSDYVGSIYQPLYTHLWTNMDATEAPVIGGKGSSANLDWDGGKPLRLPDFRGCAPVGVGAGPFVRNGQKFGEFNSILPEHRHHMFVNTTWPYTLAGNNESNMVGPLDYGSAHSRASGVDANYTIVKATGTPSVGLTSTEGQSNINANVQPSFAGYWFIRY